MGDPLNDVQMDNIEHRMLSFTGTSYITLSWLPMLPEDYEEVNMLERPFVRNLVKGQRHVELTFRPYPGPGPVSFAAWAGRWPKQPKGTNIFKRAFYELKKYIFTPPEGTRGTYIAEHSFSRESYEHRSFYIPAEVELELWRTCRKLHGLPFNTAGYYWATIWPRTTSYNEFFCSEAVLAALQISGALDHMLPPESNNAIRTMNPGRATPSLLYDALAEWGEPSANSYHVVDHSRLEQATSSANYVADSRDSDSE